MKRFKLEKKKWVIYVVNYGTFLFDGTELEAEEMRIHKSCWEGGIGRKRLATDVEIKENKPAFKIEREEDIMTPVTNANSYFVGREYVRNKTGYKKDTNYHIRFFEIEGKIIMRGFDKKNNCTDEKNIIVYNNFSSFLCEWSGVSKTKGMSPIYKQLQQYKNIKQLLHVN